MLELNTWERTVLKNVIGVNGGNMPLRAVMEGLEVLEVLELTQAEKEIVGYKETGQQAEWLDMAHVWELELSEDHARFIITVALNDNARGWPLDAMTIALRSKLEALGDLLDPE